MIDFLIKSTIALVVLLGTYHLLLEKEKFHQFNRFFLLGSIVVSFVIPFITIEIIQEVSSVSSNNVVIPEQITAVIEEEKVPIYVFIGWFLYVLITTVLFFRFVNNLYKMIRKKKSGIKIKHQNATLVLLKEQTLPYTFLKTIFINQEDYQNKKIELELFTHELIHVNQKHSLDILLIEIIKTIFWFNPVFVFYKKAIQLNHEFLADEKVVKTYNNVSFYQNLLLTKANQSPIYYLASNLNYSVTKKRLIMMTKNTTKPMSILKKIALLPVIVVLGFFLCVETVAQKVKNETKTNSKMTLEKKSELAPIQSENKEVFETNSAKKPLVEEKVALEKSASDKLIINSIETKPEFPGGIMEFYKFVGNSFKMPAHVSNNKINTKIFMQFMIEKDGSLSEFKIIKDAGYGLGDEAIRVLKLSPKWTPGTQDGKPVRVIYDLPITIQSAP
jgi:beta-lactamase regulating signal transducer with metallopeptidase domain